MSLQGSVRAVFAGLVSTLLIACDPAAPRSEQTPAPAAEQETPAALTDLQVQVRTARTEHNLIALGAVVASKDGVMEIAVSGTRERSSADPVQASDQWHIGSNTKALTALLYAQLVERGLAEWDATLPELFPHLIAKMDPAWNDITIEDLFAHRSGLQQMGGLWLNARRNDDRPVPEQRAELAQTVLSKPSSEARGAFDYNNLNYILVGAAIETILTTQDDLPNDWEQAMQVILFDALENERLRDEFGFGPPSAGLQGHRGILGTFYNPAGRGKTADNPMVLGPAGTMHASLEAHAALALEFLKDDSELIPVAMREKLFTPHPDEVSNYAMGWGIYDDPTYGRVYLHNGSNTMWTSRIIIAPALDRVVIINTNQFSESARDALRAVGLYVLGEAMGEKTAQ